MEANLSNLNSSRFLAPRHDSSSHVSTSNHHDNTHANTKTQNESVSVSKQAELAYSESLSRNSSIEIMTRDGDKVSINLSSNASYQSDFSYSDFQTQNSRQTEFSFSESKQSSLQYQLSIEGNLDTQEREAIDNLVRNINNIASELYQGDIKEALKEASLLEYNTDELQSYSFNLTQVRNQQYTAAYEEVSQLQTNTPRNIIDLSSMNLIDKLEELAANSIKSLQAFLETDQIDSLIRKVSEFTEQPSHHLSLLEPAISLDNKNSKSIFDELTYKNHN